MAEPTELPIWDENDTNTDVIPDTLKDDGFGLKQKSPSPIFNSWFRNVYKWIEWFKAKFLLVDADIERLQPVESIAALRALDITDYSNGATITATGYYAKGDGGGGPTRYLDTGQIVGFYTDNGGSIIVPIGGDGSAAWLWSQSDGIINVKEFGAYGDFPVHDDTAAIANAATWACSVVDSLRSTLYFPGGTGADGTYGTTSVVQLTRQCDIKGASKGVTVVGVNTDVFEYTTQVINTTISDLTISHSTRHTTTPNSHFAIKYNGSSGQSPFWNTIDNVFFDGFSICIIFQWAWETNINNVKAVYVGQFIKALGSCVSNRVIDSSAEGNGFLIDVGDGIDTCQGWIVDNCVFSAFSTGCAIKMLGSSYGFLTNNVFDFNGPGTAVLLQSGTSLGSFGWEIHNNYIAFGASGDVGIRLLNDTPPGATLNTGSNLTNNQIFSYSGSTLDRGILIDGASEAENYINGNKISSSIADIDNRGDNTVVTDNQLLGAGYSGTKITEYSGNNGIILSSQVLLKQSKGDFSTYYAATMPSSGSYRINDFVQNIAKSVDANNMIILGWHRITTGSGHVLNTDWNILYVSVVTPAN